MSNGSRYTHVGKSPEERAVYRDFLRSKTQLDKTASDRESFSQSDESPVEIDKITPEAVSKKSFGLKVKDFLSNNWVAGIGTSAIVAILVGLTSFLIGIHTDTKVLESEVTGINKDIDELKGDSKETKEKLSSIEIFIRELAKDLEFLSGKKSE